MATNRRQLVRLLDVNTLIALSLTNHAHHEAVSTWFDGVERWATCSITQSAYVRLLLNPSVTGFELPARDVLSALAELTSSRRHEFFADNAPLSAPAISLAKLSGPKQVTDLHLVDLAVRHQARLATVDSSMLSALAPQDRDAVELIPLR